MRQIPPSHQAGMMAVITLWVTLAALLTACAALVVPPMGVVGVGITFLVVYTATGTGLYRLFTLIRPMPSGEITPESAGELTYDCFYIPFLLFLYFPLAGSRLIPAPLTRLFHITWGARIGKNSYPSGSFVSDPLFTQAGRDVIFGYGSTIVAHVMEGSRLAHHRVRIGDRVTIGVNAVILPGVTIGDGATGAAGAVVPKFTRIGPDETWAGLPARCIKPADPAPIRSGSAV